MNVIPERNDFHTRGNMDAKGNFNLKEGYRKFYFYPGNPQKLYITIQE